MPAQAKATINQNMNDRQPDIESMILSVISIFCVTKKQGDIITPPHFFIK